MELEINEITRSARFNLADWYSPNLKIVIGGVGGIGSYLSFFLSRQEAELFVYDFDTIEEHNLGGQLYRTNDIGSKKQMLWQKYVLNFLINQLLI